QTMKKILADVQSGAFAREWMDENAKGRKRFLEMRAQAAEHPIEKVGIELRKMMAWNRPPEQEVTAAQAQARRWREVVSGYPRHRVCAVGFGLLTRAPRTQPVPCLPTTLGSA